MSPCTCFGVFWLLQFRLADQVRSGPAVGPAPEKEVMQVLLDLILGDPTLFAPAASGSGYVHPMTHSYIRGPSNQVLAAKFKGAGAGIAIAMLILRERAGNMSPLVLLSLICGPNPHRPVDPGSDDEEAAPSNNGAAPTAANRANPDLPPFVIGSKERKPGIEDQILDLAVIAKFDKKAAKKLAAWHRYMPAQPLPPAAQDMEPHMLLREVCDIQVSRLNCEI